MVQRAMALSLSIASQETLERYTTYTAFHGDFELGHDGIDVVKECLLD